VNIYNIEQMIIYRHQFLLVQEQPTDLQKKSSSFYK